MAPETPSGIAAVRPKRQAALAATIPISQMFKEDDEAKKSRMLRKLRTSNGSAYEAASSTTMKTAVSCFLCRTPVEKCVFVSNLGECMSRVTRTKLCDMLTKIAVGDPAASHALRQADMELEVLCVSCENLIQEVDTLEVKLSLMKNSVIALILKSAPDASSDLIQSDHFLHVSLADYGVFVEGVNICGLGPNETNDALEKIGGLREPDDEEEIRKAFNGSTLAEQCMNLLLKFDEHGVAEEAPEQTSARNPAQRPSSPPPPPEQVAAPVVAVVEQKEAARDAAVAVKRDVPEAVDGSVVVDVKDVETVVIDVDVDLNECRRLRSASMGGQPFTEPSSSLAAVPKEESWASQQETAASDVVAEPGPSKRVSHKTWIGRRSQMKNIDKPAEELLCPVGVEKSPELICCTCGRYFEAMKDRLAHERAHEEPPPYRCPFCREVRHDRKELREHVKSLHLKEKPSICTHCGETFVCKKKLQFHLDSLSAVSDRPFVCTWPGCHEAFVAQTELDVHTLGHSNNSKPKILSPKTYVCRECGKKYRRARSLKQHMLSHSAFACKACPQVFIDKGAFIQHVMDAHSGDDRPVPPKKTVVPAVPVAAIVKVESSSPLKTKIRVNNGSGADGVPGLVKKKPGRPPKLVRRQTEEILVTDAPPPLVKKEACQYPCPVCQHMCADAYSFREHYDTCRQSRAPKREVEEVPARSGTPTKKKRRVNKTGWPTAARLSRPSCPSPSSSSSPAPSTSKSSFSFPRAAAASAPPSSSSLSSLLSRSDAIQIFPCAAPPPTAVRSQTSQPYLVRRFVATGPGGDPYSFEENGA